MAERVERDDLVEQVTRLATDHADLVLAVRELLDHVETRDCSEDLDGCVVVTTHIAPYVLAELRRLTGDS